MKKHCLQDWLLFCQVSGCWSLTKLLACVGKWLGSRPIRCNWAMKTNMGPQVDEAHTGGNGLVMNAAIDQMAALQAPLVQGALIFGLHL